MRVYSLILELDRPDKDPRRVGGCYMGEAELAQQAGVSLDYARRLRRELAAWGLVHRVSVERCRADFWFADLPPVVDHEPPVGTVQDKRQWVRIQADRLSAHIADVTAEIGRASCRERV